MGVILPITESMLVGQLRRELSYQFGMECATRVARMTEAARLAYKTKQNRPCKTMRLMAEIPAREVFRIEQEIDPHFFKEHKNIRKLVQEHPELKGGIGN